VIVGDLVERGADAAARAEVVCGSALLSRVVREIPALESLRLLEVREWN
jgi:hypothetical protein